MIIVWYGYSILMIVVAGRMAKVPMLMEGVTMASVARAVQQLQPGMDLSRAESIWRGMMGLFSGRMRPEHQTRLDFLKPCVYNSKKYQAKVGLRWYFS